MDVEIKDLKVSVEGKTVLDKLNLSIKKGEIHVLMGPNGTGKSTERAKLGIFLSFQDPTVVEGVTNQEFLKMAINSKRETPIGLYDFIKDLSSSYDDLKLSHSMMHRGINENFSGGEKKKNEIVTMKVLKPEFIILDELDSGLDVDSLKIVCKNIKEYLKDNNASVLIITHYNKILEYIKPDYVHVLTDGTIKETGDYSLALDIEKNGFKKYSHTNALGADSSYE